MAGTEERPSSNSTVGVEVALNESNRLSDFPTEQFTICLFCDACGNQADLDCMNVPEDMTMQELPKHLRCTSRGSLECSIRIVYTGAGDPVRRRPAARGGRRQTETIPRTGDPG